MCFRYGAETFQVIAGYLLASPIPEHQFGPPRQPAPYTLAPADKVAALLESLNSPEPLNDANAHHRDLILSILTRSMKNRFLRSFKMEVASMKWSPGIVPIQIAFEYENLYRRAALPSELSEASAALDKARSKTRVLLHEHEAESWKALRERFESSGSKSSRSDALDIVQAEQLRKSLLEFEHSVAGAVGVETLWSRELYLDAVAKAKTVDDFKACLSDLHGALSKHAFKSSWDHGTKKKNQGAVKLRPGPKSMRRQKAAGNKKRQTANPPLPATQQLDTEVVAELLCDKWMYTLELLRTTRVDQGQRVERLVQIAMVEMGPDGHITNALKRLLEKRRELVDTDDNGLSLESMLANRDLRDGALDELDNTLGWMLEFSNTENCLPSAFAHCGWRRADIKESNKYLPEVLGNPYYFNKANRQTKWNIAPAQDTSSRRSGLALLSDLSPLPVEDTARESTSPSIAALPTSTLSSKEASAESVSTKPPAEAVSNADLSNAVVPQPSRKGGRRKGAPVKRTGKAETTCVFIRNDNAFSTEDRVVSTDKACSKQLRKMPPALTINAADQKHLCRRPCQKIPHARYRPGNVEGLSIDGNGIIVIDGIEYFASFSPAYQWETSLASACTAAHVALRLAALYDNINWDMMESAAPLYPVCRDVRLAFVPAADDAGSSDLHSDNADSAPVTQQPDNMKLEYYVIDEDGYWSWDASHDVPIVTIRVFNETILDASWKAQLPPCYASSVLPELQKRDPSSPKKKSKKQKKPAKQKPAKSLPRQPSSPPPTRSEKEEALDDLSDDDFEPGSLFSSFEIDPAELGDLSFEEVFVMAAERPKKKRKGGEPGWKVLRCKRPDCPSGGFCRHCPCDGSCLRGHRPGLCCANKVLGKRIKNGRMKSGYQIRNYGTCNACKARQGDLRTGRRTGKLTKENYDRTRKRNGYEMTFEEVTSSYGDATAPKSE